MFQTRTSAVGGTCAISIPEFARFGLHSKQIEPFAYNDTFSYFGEAFRDEGVCYFGK